MTAPALSWKAAAAAPFRSGCCYQGTPVLGVVYAPTSPDRGPDLIAWAHGSRMTRNGVPVDIDLSRQELSQDRRRLPQPWRGAAPGLEHRGLRAGTLHAVALYRLPSGAGRGGRRPCHRHAAPGQRARHRRRARLAACRQAACWWPRTACRSATTPTGPAARTPASAARPRRLRRCGRARGVAARSPGERRPRHADLATRGRGPDVSTARLAACWA